MITLLHGDHIEVSRTELNRLKAAAVGREVRQVDGRNLEASTLVQALESGSLFGGDTTIIVEHLFGKLGRQIKKAAEYCSIIAKAAQTSDVIIWEDKEVSATVVKQLGPHTTIRVFKLPVLIFQFLDGVRPGNRQATLLTYGTLTETTAAELVFSMLIKRVRQLIGIADGHPPAGVAPWQLGRLTTQAKSFTMSELISLYTALGDAEYGVKSGASPFGLKALTQQALLTI
jgi:hypothetical protein